MNHVTLVKKNKPRIPPKQKQCCVRGCEQTRATHFYFFPPQGENAADDYQLSADRKYVAFMSNYSKVASVYIYAQCSPQVSWSVFIFVLLAVEAFIYCYIFTLWSGIRVSTKNQIGFLRFFWGGGFHHKAVFGNLATVNVCTHSVIICN